MRTTLNKAINIIENDYDLLYDTSEVAEGFNTNKTVEFEIEYEWGVSTGKGYLITMIEKDKDNIYNSIVEFDNKLQELQFWRDCKS